jgi:hypothetical protein
LAEKGFEKPLPSLADFPRAYLQHMQKILKNAEPLQFWKSKGSNLYKSLKRGRLPRGILSPHTESSIFYSVVPLVFAATVLEGDELTRSNNVTRGVLRKRRSLAPPHPDGRLEWDHLREQTHEALTLQFQ